MAGGAEVFLLGGKTSWGMKGNNVGGGVLYIASCDFQVDDDWRDGRPMDEAL